MTWGSSVTPRILRTVHRHADKTRVLRLARPAFDLRRDLLGGEDVDLVCHLEQRKRRQPEAAFVQPGEPDRLLLGVQARLALRLLDPGARDPDLLVDVALERAVLAGVGGGRQLGHAVRLGLSDLVPVFPAVVAIVGRHGRENTPEQRERWEMPGFHRLPALPVGNPTRAARARPTYHTARSRSRTTPGSACRGGRCSPQAPPASGRSR